MNIQLHQNARTPPAIRQELQNQPPSGSNQELAEAYNLNRHTVAKWRQREGTEDASHRPHRLHATLNGAQEAVVVALRETLLLPLDDLLAVTREFIPPRFRARPWTAVCAAMGFLTSRRHNARDDLQGLRAGLCARRCQVPASDARPAVRRH